MDREKQAPTGPVVDAEGTRWWVEDGRLKLFEGCRLVIAFPAKD